MDNWRKLHIPNTETNEASALYNFYILHDVRGIVLCILAWSNLANFISKKDPRIAVTNAKPNPNRVSGRFPSITHLSMSNSPFFWIILVILLTPDVVISALIYVIVLTFFSSRFTFPLVIAVFDDWCVNNNVTLFFIILVYPSWNIISCLVPKCKIFRFFLICLRIRNCIIHFVL